MNDALVREVEAQIVSDLPAALGVAVSGGSDSTALLILLCDVSSRHGFALHAATVDHGLRSEAATEAQTVAALCERLGVPHTTLKWQGWDGQGNLQDQARRARIALLSQWAKTKSLHHLALGHTADDQAETMLMRLARGAGVDGLSAMAPRMIRDGLTWVRPLLSLRRADLRADLVARGLAWTDDPSNEDTGFDRIRARKALSVLEPLGVDADALGQVAQNMRMVRHALGRQAEATARSMVSFQAGALRFNHAAFADLPTEIARRMLVAALNWISGAEYPPRRAPVRAALEQISAGKTVTLGGCQISQHRGDVWIYREPAAVADERVAIGEIWDGRWCVSGPSDTGDCHVAALQSSGLSMVQDWRATGLPRPVLLGSAAVWHGDELIAAPLAFQTKDWHAVLQIESAAYYAALLSH